MNSNQQTQLLKVEAASFEFVVEANDHFAISFFSREAEQIIGQQKPVNLNQLFDENIIYQIKIGLKTNSSFQLESSLKKGLFQLVFIPLAEQKWQCTLLQKNTEDDLKLMNERFQLVAEAADEAIWDWDIEGKSIYWNQAFYKLSGYKKEEIPKGDFEWWIKLLKEEDRLRLFLDFLETIKNPKKEKWHQEYSIKKADGSYMDILAKGKLIRNKKGKVIRMVGAFTDISAQKNQEDSLRYLNQQLETSNQELEQFAYAISHDLQEPLRMVVSFLERLENKYYNQIDDKGKKYIEFAVDGGKRMRRMIMDLLDYSRVGRRNGKLEQIDLNEIIEEVKALNKTLIDESAAIIKSNLMPTITAYRSPVLQVFHNVISNALKYQNKGVSPEIIINFKSIEDYIQIAIKDNGIGIDADFYDKVFAVFQRLHRREEYSGTGMGLAIVKKVITGFGGNVWIDSKVGEGSTFYFTIPKEIKDEAAFSVEESSTN